MVGRTAKFSKTMWEVAYGRKMNLATALVDISAVSMPTARALILEWTFYCPLYK
jgi:hypothetical protein